MTESEWDTCQDATAMLQFLRGKGGKRKMRLLACACARSLWSGLVEDEFRKAVEISEQCADGLAGLTELREAENAIGCLGWGTVRGDGDANGAAEATVEDFSGDAAEHALAHLRDGAADLIREIFGNPLRVRSIGAVHRQLHRGQFQDMARTIYEERCFQELPRLADLLVEAGCRDEELLKHLRSRVPIFVAAGLWTPYSEKDRGRMSSLRWSGLGKPTLSIC